MLLDVVPLVTSKFFRRKRHHEGVNHIGTVEECNTYLLKIVPALAAQISGKVGVMKPQDLSNCLWASSHFKKFGAQRPEDHANSLCQDPRQDF